MEQDDTVEQKASAHSGGVTLSIPPLTTRTGGPTAGGTKNESGTG